MIGLGEVGSAVAERLMGRGYSVVGYDPNPLRGESARAAGVSVVPDPGTVVELSDGPTILIVATAGQAIDACLGDSGAFARIESKLLIVMSSLNPPTVQLLDAEATRRGGMVLDSPLGGGAPAARTGTMSLMVAGSGSAVAGAKSVLGELASSVELVGEEPGLGQAMKLITQVALAVSMTGVNEALRLSRHYGLDRNTTLRSISASSAGSWVSSHWDLLISVMKPNNVGNVHKDLRAIIASAVESDISTPVAMAAMSVLRSTWAEPEGAADGSGQ